MPAAARSTCVWGFVWCIILVLLLFTAGAAASDTSGNPVVYLNFNEGGSNLALDASGNGNTGTIHGTAYRVDNSGCVRALMLTGNDSYVSIPYTPANHPADAITVSAWFYVNTTSPQTLVSTYADGGGYRLGFDEGNDLWWTVGLDSVQGSVSVVIPHEAITTGQWHQVTGSYDGEVAKIYLDGILRSQENATGSIQYADNNAILIGANAGPAGLPDQYSPDYLNGAIDEVRIYNQALSYSEEMDDRYSCSATPGTGILSVPGALPPVFRTSGTLALAPGETAVRRLTFANQSEQGTWLVTLPPGSKLSVGAADAYPDVYSDEWYVELQDQNTRLTRIVAFPMATNAPAEGVIESGNATVLVHYFGGPGRFPASMSLTFTASAPPESPVVPLPKAILQYPVIVFYSASWVTLIALVVVIVWAHRRRSERSKKE